jgi:histidine triad (HIT) family protein
VTEDCVLCAIVSGSLPSRRVGQNDRALAFLDINPATEGHTLVVPKAHTPEIWDLPRMDGHAVIDLVRETADLLRRVLRPEGMTLFQANGGAGWQDVGHVLVHLVPRWMGDGLTKPWGGAPGDPATLDAIAARLRRR